MKINNKGVTLLEMLVTVALLSVMMIFMYKLLNGISFEKDNEFFSSKNQDLRVQIIDRLEGLNDDNLIKSITNHGSFIAFYDSIGAISSRYTLNITDDRKAVYLEDGNTYETVDYWALDGGAYFGDEIYCDDIDSGAYTFYRCLLRVFTNNKDNSYDNNNAIDDIEFYYKISY